MTDNEDELYDFYVEEEDGFDTQEDLYEEEPIGHNEEPVGSSDSGNRSKSGFNFFFVIVFVALIAGGFILYQKYGHPRDTPSIPIVKLDTAPPSVDNSSQNDLLQPETAQTTHLNDTHDTSQNLVTQETEISVFAEDLYKDAQDRQDVQESQENESILTPLPSLAEIQDVNISPVKTDLDSAALDIEAEKPLLIAENAKPDESAHESDKITDSDAPTAPMPALEKEVYIPEVSAVPPPSEQNKSTSSHGIRIITPKSKPAKNIVQRNSTKKVEAPVKEKKPDNIKTVTHQWVIKAILPGKAVIHDKVSGETRSVEIGDHVPSVGKILSIRKVNGKWLITGSKYRIIQ